MHGIIVTIKWAKSYSVDYRLMARKQKVNQSSIITIIIYGLA